MKKVLLLTPMSLEPLHPRVELIKNILENNGYGINIYNLNKSKFNKINYLLLGFFNIVAFFKAFSLIFKLRNNIDILYITDLQYLLIA